MSTVLGVVPTATDCAAIEPTACGFWLVTTVTAMVCVAVNLPSLAVTVIVAAPVATPVMVTFAPETPTVALLVAEEEAR